LHDYLLASAQRLPDKVALVCGANRLPYRDIDRQSNALAHALTRAGVERGDRVLVFADNSVEAALAFWGVLKANAVAVIVNPLTKAPRLRQFLADCGATGLVTNWLHAPVFVDAAQDCRQLRIVVAAGPAGTAAPASLPLVAWNEAVSSADLAPPPRLNCDVDLAAIIYTSGSTGDPKGIMLTHRNMLAAATSITAYLENTEDDVILGTLPLSFDYGLYQMIMAFRMGARLVLERSFSYPTQVLEVVQREGVTGFPGVPTMFGMMARMTNLSRFDLSAVRYVTNTAAALSLQHVAFLRRSFPHARIYSMYGLSECKRCTYLPPEDLVRKPDSVGIPIPNTEIWLVDEHDNRLGPNQVGQLEVRGATVMRGYWGKPEATARRLKPGPLPGEYVLYTGDYCRFDDEGYLYFVGRMDDIVKTRGEKVAPKEVEDALLSIPGVREAAVIAVPDELFGQALKAFVVWEGGFETHERQFRLECHARLESYKVPRDVVVVSELPRTPSGKVDKLRLSAQRD
jgi:amino acid adenylation domain-containing protein